MNSIYQKTFSKPVIFKGVGLHSGKCSTIKVLPGPEDQGIVFKRVDLEKNNIIKADFNNVSSTKLCTTLENSYGVKVSTVEHLIAAIYLTDIDNATIEADNEEVPIMDGSAKDFLNSFKNTEILVQEKKRKYLKVLKNMELKDGERSISIEPNDNSLIVDFELDYENKVIGKQKNIINFNQDDFKHISESRTFCLFKDIEKIKKIGLAKGGSLDNAIVVDKDKVLNEKGLRNDKEFVNHKILDLVGDCMLSGYRILGKIKCSQGGHELTNLFLRKIFNNRESIKLQDSNNILPSKKISSNSSLKLAINA